MALKKNHVFFVLLATLIFSCRVNTDSMPSNEQSQNSSEVNSTPHVNSNFPLFSLTYLILKDILFGVPTKKKTACKYSCGVANNNGFKEEDISLGRIVGGQETKPNKYPWMVQLSYFNFFYCSGSLVNDRFVLTAGQCAIRWLPSMIKVTLGSHNRCKDDSLTWSTYVSHVKTPSSRSVSMLLPMFGQDIALLRLDDPAPLSPFIRPISLPQTNTLDYTGYNAVIAGWGSRGENIFGIQCLLRSATVPIMSNSQCFGETEYEDIAVLLETDNWMCAGYSSGGVDSCRADSGGPLAVQRYDGRFEVVGIYSWSMGCGKPKTPGVYTRITKHLDWIRENINEGCSCQD